MQQDFCSMAKKLLRLMIPGFVLLLLVLTN